ncbi:hypothetical protein [Candidatus Allofournierella excrementigallinarum]|uniref:hypothetical protein n=1 Tax=Candidatus Allofournierella excrementigallinarum TaxID=2838592 RepID=UPI00374F8617
MSFVYAVKEIIKYDSCMRELTYIYSDTKISLDGTCKSNWGTQTREMIEHYGLIKSMIVGPRCCISFAGNNIAYAHRLLYKLFEAKQFKEDELIDLAWEIHSSAAENEIEFIICLADEADKTEIVCIKNQTIQRDCSSAWIGSEDAFRHLQKYRMADVSHLNEYLKAFNYAMRCCKDDSVGGFCISVIFSNSSHQFEYQERLELAVEREQKVLPGMPIKLVGSAEEGASTLHYYPSDLGVEIQIDQINLTIVFTSKYRLESEDCEKADTKHFLLPIKIRTDSREVLLG